MSEGGEARNHEAAEVEAVARAIAKSRDPVATWPDHWTQMSRDRFMRDAEAALDAVRCAQGRDTDASEPYPSAWECAGCGHRNRPGMVVCVNCGQCSPQSEGQETKIIDHPLDVADWGEGPEIKYGDPPDPEYKFRSRPA